MAEQLEDEDPTVEESAEKPTHPIAQAIDDFVHSVLDIRESVERLIPLAAKELTDEVDKINETFDNGRALLRDSEDDKEKYILGIKELSKGRRLAERLEKSQLIETLVNSLFINLFSAFDRLTGSLLFALFRKKPELFNSINKDIALSEVLQSDSIDEIKTRILESEIEAIRRKSYTDQFKELENKFNIKLTQFKTWPIFIEASQRRNLLTHCDGVVSQQYLSACAGVNYKGSKDCSKGDKLKVDPQYFYLASIVITEVGVMLAQTLWRKVVPGELSDVDSHLQRLIYDFLNWEDWGVAIRLSQFAKDLPRHSDEITRRIILINYAIALDAIEEKEAAVRLLDKEDWSAMLPDFKLAVSVLKGNEEEAVALMKSIGKTGEMVSELAYHEWPLFRNFRDKECFLVAYQDIYGYPFVDKLSELAEESRKESAEKLSEGAMDSPNKGLNVDIQKLRDAPHLNAS